MKNDLSHKLTVFVISCGNNPNYDDCINALTHQTIRAKISIIKNYHPMSLAFQQMLERCQSQYYIELDEDMILKKDALERMYNAIEESEDKTAMIAFRLHDTHLNFNLFGVKIYKYDIFKKYPYNLECLSCEVEQLDRIKADGYEYSTLEPVMGEHSPHWTNEGIFERYFNLMEKFKEFGYVWLENLPSKLVHKITENPTEQNIHALLGAYTSIIKTGISKDEKDFTQSKSREYGLMEGYLSQPHSATIYLTSKCNFNCHFCYRQHNDVENAPDVDITMTTTLLNKFPSIKAVCVCGFGETFLSPNLKWVIQTLKQRNVFVGIITNGSFLKDKLDMLEKDDCLPNYISVSLNAANKFQHEKITGTKSFWKVKEGIKLCISKGIDTFVTHVCTKENLKQVPAFLKLANNLGVKTVYLHNLLPHFNEKENDDFWNLVLQKKDQPLIDKIKLLPEANIVKGFPILIDKNETRRNCKFPWTSIAVNGNGSISLCNSVYPCDSKNGDIHDYSPCWQNEYSRNLRESLLGEQLPACKKCFRNWE